MANSEYQGFFLFGFEKRQWLKLLIINTFIAVFLALVTQTDFWINFIYSQSIGISVASFVCISLTLKKKRNPHILQLGIAIVLGVLVGISLATFLTGSEEMIMVEKNRDIMISSFLYSIIIGCIVVYYFSLIAKHQEISNQLNIEKLKQIEYERALIDNNLKLLQAQIEPHFLFNTLSNILSLIDSRPHDAKVMLESFTDYLRASLSRTRESDTTLGDEIDIVNAYLSIQKIRMGKRLNYDIACADDLKEIRFPPLLIQPLVENSIRHGLESEIDGGSIMLNIDKKAGILSVTVVDTGKGTNNMDTDGIGLKNIKQRLTSLFAEDADLFIEKNEPKGLKVTLHIPLGEL